MTLTQITEKGIKDGEIINADINASAAIAKSKIENLINNNADNRVITGSGTANTLNGEADLTFDGNDLTINKTGGDSDVIIKTTTSGNPTLKFNASGAGGHEIGFDRSTTALTFTTTGSAERMRIDSSGRVGIGTTSPSTNLHVHTDSHGEGVLIKSTGNTSNALTFDANRGAEGVIAAMYGRWNGTTVAQISFVSGSDSTNKDDGFITFGTESAASNGNVNASEKMRIDSSGRMLIGSTDGATYSEDWSDDLIVGSTANGKNDGITILSGTSQNGSLAFADSGGASRGLVGYVHNGDYLRFHTAGSERMRIDSSGNMGLGVTPSANWPVSADFRAFQVGSGACIFGRGSGDEDRGGVAVNYYHTGGAEKYLANGNSSGIFFLDGEIELFTADANTSGADAALTRNTRMKIENLGRTLITQGNSNQAFPALVLQRPSAATNVQNTMLTITCGGQDRGQLVSGSSASTAPQLSTTSDYRIKENIRNYTDGWNNIKAIPVKLFDVKLDGSKDIKGWIAHEVQPHIPEAVIGEKDAVVTQAMVDSGERTKEELGKNIYQSLGMGAFMPDVVSALQEAMARIETLETKVEALEAA